MRERDSQSLPCHVLHIQSRHRDVQCVCERLLHQEQLEKPFREEFTGVQGGNGPVLSLVSCCFNSRLSELGVPQHRAVTLWTARTLVTDWGPVTLRSSWEVAQGEVAQPGTCQGWRAGYSCTLFHSSLSSWLSPKPDPRKKPIQFPPPDKPCRLMLEGVSYFWKHPLEHFPLKALVYP